MLGFCKCVVYFTEVGLHSFSCSNLSLIRLCNLIFNLRFLLGEQLDVSFSLLLLVFKLCLVDFFLEYLSFELEVGLAYIDESLFSL